MKNEISPLRVAHQFLHGALDENTVIFTPRNEEAAIDFLNYLWGENEKFYHSIKEYWYRGSYLTAVLLKRNNGNKWQLWASFHGYYSIKVYDGPDFKVRKLAEAFLIECWDSYFKGEEIPLEPLNYGFS